MTRLRGLSLQSRDPDQTRVWLYLRERYLSHLLHADYHAGVDACCKAWNALAAETGRLRSLCTYSYIEQVAS